MGGRGRPDPNQHTAAYSSKPCFACRMRLPWPCRCNHSHDFHYPPGTVLGRGERLITCSICGLTESDGIDGGD